MENFNQQINIINESSEFLDEEDSFNSLISSNSPFGSKYIVISISGPQSSGKSTFLNQLFGTSFKMLNLKKEGFRRTTKGLNLALLSPPKFQYPFLVLDTEGTDSSDRREDKSFESQLTLFSLCVSHIFIANIWFRDLGRHSASGVNLLQRVIEVFIQAFSMNKKIWLIFLIRDYKKEMVSKENLESLLKENMEYCWNKASTMKEEWKDKKAEEVFELEILCFPEYFDFFNSSSNFYNNDNNNNNNETLEKIEERKELKENTIKEEEIKINKDFIKEIDRLRKRLKDKLIELSLRESKRELLNEFDSLQASKKVNLSETILLNGKKLSSNSNNKIISSSEMDENFDLSKDSENIKEFEICDFKTNVPLKDIYNYWKSLWLKIKFHKDLNLPNERKLISLARCKIIVEEIILNFRKNFVEKFEEEFKNFEISFCNEKDKEKEIFKIIKSLKKELKESFSKFKEETIYYEKEIVKEFKEKLFESLNEELLEFFDYCLQSFSKEIKNIFEKYSKMIENKNLNFFVIEKNEILFEKEIIEKNLKMVKIFKDENGIINDFELFKNSLKIELEKFSLSFYNIFEIQIEKNFTFSINKSKIINSFSEIFDFYLKSIINIQINLIKEKIKSKIKEQKIELSLKLLLNELPFDLLEKMKSIKEEIIIEVRKDLTFLTFPLLKDKENNLEIEKKIEEEIILEIFITFEKSLAYFIEVSLHSKIIQLFEKEFLFDEEKLPKRYDKISDSRESFRKASENLIKRLTIFKEENFHLEFNKEKNFENLKGNKKELKLLNSLKFEEMKKSLMSYAAMKAVEIENIIDAKNSLKEKIPNYVYGLLLFFAWNEIFYVLKRPLLFILILILLMVFVFMKKTNNIFGFFKFESFDYWKKKCEKFIKELMQKINEWKEKLKRESLKKGKVK